MCQNGITCLGLFAIAWPVAALVAIGLIYLRQFVKWLVGPNTPTLDLQTAPRPKRRFHNTKD